MTTREFETTLGQNIAAAIANGTHQMSIVAMLEAQKWSLLQQAFEANRNQAQGGKFKTFIDEGGKGEN